MDARALIAEGLERGSLRFPLARFASRVWERAAEVARPLRWPEGARVISVGGSTLGGSGKTPLAIACALVLEERGGRVALVGHSYGARPGQARVVSPGDPVSEVGDEALECAGRLSRIAAPVVVAPTRQRALDLALELADVVVVDGLLQATPRRTTLALLAVDGETPWGAGRCPPLGDLRAQPAALLAAADRVVALGALGADPMWDIARLRSRGAWRGGALVDWGHLASLRVGLWTAIARPERLVRQLAARGIRPVVTRCGADHRGPRPSAAVPRRDIDVWLTTPKCHAHVGPSGELGGVPVATLEIELDLGPGLRAALGRAGGRVRP